MSAGRTWNGGRRSVLAGALGAVVDFLVEPAEPAAAPAHEVPVAPLSTRVAVAVVGLAPRCGVTTVARALGAELAARHAEGCAVVSTRQSGGGVPLGLPAAARLARNLAPATGGRVRAAGRLCLAECPEPARLVEAARYLAPLVLDVQDSASSAAAAALADHVVLVGAPGAEPALADVLTDSLARVGPPPIVVVNRADEHEVQRWGARASLALPESRMGAQLALAGREPSGALGSAVEALAERVDS